MMSSDRFAMRGIVVPAADRPASWCALLVGAPPRRDIRVIER